MDCDSTTFIGKDCESRDLIDKIARAQKFYCDKLRRYKRIIGTSCVEFPSEPPPPDAPEEGFVCTLNPPVVEKPEINIKYFDVTTIDLEVVNAMSSLEDELCGLEELILILEQKINEHCNP